MTSTATTSKRRYHTFLFNSDWHSRIIGFLVGILMIAIYLWIFLGFSNLLVDLFHAYQNNSWSHGAETMIKDVVILLASLELIRLFQSYLMLGRVKVTFILDVALVVLIGELISLWYREYEINEVLLSIFVITILTALRIVTTKFSPDNSESDLDR